MGRKDFNKGMEAGARPFEDKFRQEQKRNQEWKRTFEEKFDDMKETNEAILDEMESREKEKFYKSHMIMDIKELGKGDRETLLSILFTLSAMEDEVTEYQQQFIRSVKKYLENTEDGRKPEQWSVLKDNDWSIIETITGIEETKAIVQVVTEFLFLGYQDYRVMWNEYEDLFDCFNLNRKGFDEIWKQIDVIYAGTGLQGIAEMYGFAPEKSDDKKDAPMQNVNFKQYGAYGTSDELKIIEEIKLEDGEKRIFENKKIIFEKGIYGPAKDNKLVFKNCEIIVQEEKFVDKKIIISGLENGEITFESCTIKNGKCVLVDCCQMKLIIKDSYLNADAQVFNDNALWGGGSASIRHCYIDLSQNRKNDCIFSCGEFEMFDTFIYGGEEKEGIYSFHLSSSAHSLFGSNKSGKERHVHIEECRFYNLPDLLIQGKSEIVHSVFENCCVKICDASWHEYGVFSNCEFQNCIFAEAYGEMDFEDTKLLSCVGILPTNHMKDATLDGGFLVIWGAEDIKLTRCNFSNWSEKSCESVVDKNGNNLFSYSHLNFGRREQEAVIVACGYSKIIDCHFENMDLGERYLIGGSRTDHATFEIKDCHFENVQTGSKGFFREKFYYKVGGLFRDKDVTDTISVITKNCTGL